MTSLAQGREVLKSHKAPLRPQIQFDVQTGGGKMVSPCVGRKESGQSDREAKTESTQLMLEDEGEPGPGRALFVGRYFWRTFCLYQS